MVARQLQLDMSGVNCVCILLTKRLLGLRHTLTKRFDLVLISTEKLMFFSTIIYKLPR